MGIPLKQLLPLLMAAILFGTGSLVAIGGIFYFYNSDVREEIENKTELMLTVAAAVRENGSTLHEIVLNTAGDTPSVVFLRVIEISSQQILASARQMDEVGSRTSGMPQFTTNSIAVRSQPWSSEPFADIAVSVGNNKALWMQISLNDHYRRALASVAISTTSILLVILIGYFILYIVLKRILLVPVGRIIRRIAIEERNLPPEPESVKISEIADLLKAINEMKRRFTEALERENSISRIKSDFLTVATHRLRTPISGIKWALKTLEDPAFGSLSDDQKNILEKAYQANERMVRLIDDLLDVTRIEEGKFGYEFRYANIVEIIRTVIDEFRPQYENKHVALILREPHEVIPNVKFDVPKIKLVMETLLSNSLNYTPSGGSLEISVAKKDNDFVEVAAYDTGVGIPAGDMTRIFTKFFRSREAIKLDTEGTGLGLFIAKNIIANHGGTIGLESKEGVGTTVSFTLPLHEKLLPKGEKTFEEFMKL